MFDGGLCGVWVLNGGLDGPWVLDAGLGGAVVTVGSWWVDWVRARALPFLAASSAAFAASSAFGLALLGAIAGGFLVALRWAPNVGTCSQSQGGQQG